MTLSYETWVTAYPPEKVDDLLARDGKTCPPGWLVIVDAEMDLVAFVPEEMADDVVAALNAAE